MTLEEAYLGYRATTAEGLTFDVSVGPRELRLGTGMLISNGASSGFQRGALKFGPRKAWEMSAIASLARDGTKGTLFFIDPNELPTNSSGNQIAGLDIRHDRPDGDFLGLTYLHVLESRAPYPSAAPFGIGPPVITPGAREGLNAVNFYARVSPFEGAFENWAFGLDGAYQWNDRIDLNAWGGRAQAGYRFSNLPWSPELTYAYQTLSGDDPNTTGLERFDPLYYDGSPAAWATGSKSAMVFINSNINAHSLTLRLSPSPRDTITFRYAHIRANELLSPIQFGQATRVAFSNGVPTVISGVITEHLSDDLFVEYSRILNPNTYLTAGVSVSMPGSAITSTFPGNVPNWSGGFVNVVVNF